MTEDEENERSRLIPLSGFHLRQFGGIAVERK
jgi:hypothetical protein